MTNRARILVTVAVLAGGTQPGCTHTVDPPTGQSESPYIGERACADELSVGVVPAQDADQAARECEMDEGPCTGNIGCTGSVTDRICDPQRFVVTPSAALCIAQAHGFQDGLNTPTLHLLYNYGYRRVIWTVANLTHVEALSQGGQLFSIDAVTGAMLDDGGWSAIE